MRALQTPSPAVTASNQAVPHAAVSTIASRTLPAIVLVIAYGDGGKPAAQGSGVLVSADGKIATNYHVIGKARSITVKFRDGAFYEIQNVVSSDEGADLAILQIKATTKEFPFLRLADSNRVEIGEEVVAIGSPLSLEGTVSTGIISAIRNANDVSSGRPTDARVLQTTAPVSPGSSGGPLLNLQGEVVGLTSFGYLRGQNLNFAIPSNEVSALLQKPSPGVPLPKSSEARPKSVVTSAEILRSANTLCVWVRSGNPVLKSELNAKLVEWGKLTLVSSPDDADLILEIVQTSELNIGTGAGNQATALLRHRESGIELWSKTKGGGWSMRGWSNSAVAHGLANEFTKFFDSATKEARH